MHFQEYERIIRSLARRFAKNNYEIEDFEQIGRLKAWELTETQSNKPRAYIIKAIKNEMLRKIRHENAKKRNSGLIISLNDKISNKDNRNLEEIIGENKEIKISEERISDLKDILKSKYSRYWIKNLIALEKKPKVMCRKIIRAAIEDVAGIEIKDIPEVVNFNFFRKLKLDRLLWVFYKNSPYKAVNDAYPDVFLPWNFKRTPLRFWKGRNGLENAVEAMKWFVRAKQIKSEDECRYIKIEDFKECGLSGMVQIVFNGSPYLALSTIFPDLKPWQTQQTAKNYFKSKKNRLIAIDWFLQKKGVGLIKGLSPEEVYDTDLKKLSLKREISREGLRGLLKQYNGSVYDLFSNLYPKQILPWTLKKVKKPWKENPKETAAEAIKWLFEKYLAIPITEIPKYASCRLFWNVGFSGVLTNRKIGFNSSPYKAVDNAYPGLFSEDEFKRYK